MPGTPHEQVVLSLRDRPELLSEVLRRLADVRLAGPMQVIDTAVRFTPSMEVRPDLLLSRPPSDSGVSPWLMVEVQNRRDERKGKSWHLAASVLLQSGIMGDLVVITPSRGVARWAKRVAHHRGELGTRAGLTPVVVHVSKDRLEPLLDKDVPELAVLAVWAGARGDGPEARRVVERAIEVTEELPEPLRDRQVRAILAMLSGRLVDSLTETAMDVNEIPETKAVRRLRLFFEGRAKREALLRVLAARGLAPTEEDRKQIDAAADPQVLDAWIDRAVTASTVAEVLETTKSATEPTRATPAKNGRPARRRTSKG